jgi:chromosome segregation ATPase
MQNAFNSKNYNDINEEMIGALKQYDLNGKGPYKDETAFEFLKNKEGGVIKNLKELMIQEGQKNMKKLDNNLKMAQADLDDMNNMKRVVDEKKRIHTEKMQGLENENNQLNQEIGELKELLAVKQKTLNNLKKRNEQSKKNKKKLIEIHNKEVEENASNKNRLDVLNESDDIGIKNGKKNNSNNQMNNNNNTKTKKKKKNEPGCECIIS